jgi:hypothetical protein
MKLKAFLSIALTLAITLSAFAITEPDTDVGNSISVPVAEQAASVNTFEVAAAVDSVRQTAPVYEVALSPPGKGEPAIAAANAIDPRTAVDLAIATKTRDVTTSGRNGSPPSLEFANTNAPIAAMYDKPGWIDANGHVPDVDYVRRS